MKRLAVAFSGPSNSGKTTLILRLAQKFIKDGLKVAIIKHDPSDKAKFDVEGKDSYLFSQTGAQVAVLSPTRTTVFSKQPSDIDKAISLLGEFDILLVEGLKTIQLPRISVFKDQIDEAYLPFSQAIASYKKTSKENIVNLNLDDIDSISKWIFENAKEV